MPSNRNIIVGIISSLLILLFVYAAMSKLLEYPLFVAQLHTHPYLKLFAGLLAWMVPAAEIITSILLIFALTRLTGLYASALLLIVFTTYLALMLLTDKNLPCSCGGVISGMSWRQHVVFNLFFIALSITGIVLMKNRNRTAKSSNRTV